MGNFLIFVKRKRTIKGRYRRDLLGVNRNGNNWGQKPVMRVGALGIIFSTSLA